MQNSIIQGTGPQQFNTLCKITELGNKNSEKLVIALGSLIHRTKFAWGNMSEIISQDYNARFVSFDWPKKEFDEKKVLSQIEEYINNSNAEEIVLAGLSFGDIIANKLLKKLSPEIKSKIKGHISISGVTNFDELAGMDAIGNFKNIISTKVVSILAKTILGVVGKTDRGTKFNHFASKNMVDSNTEYMEQNPNKLQKHIKAASIGLNPGLVDRFQIMLKNDYNQNPENQNTEIPTFAIYSSNDPTFKNPRQNAAKALKGRKNTKLIEIKDGGHAALVEQAEKYDKEIKNIFDKIFKS